jgi:uncharacterized protein YjbJ (UPF0337 family)
MEPESGWIIWLGNGGRMTHCRHQPRRFPMGELIDKTKGLANEAAGNVKQAAGEARNDPDQKAEGLGQELKGKMQKLSGSIKGALGDKV